MFTNKVRISNLSLVSQIIIINLFVIFISFILFGLYNFYSLSSNLDIEKKTTDFYDFNEKIVNSISNNAIKFPFYSTSDEIFLIQKNKLELEPYAASKIIEGFKNSDSEIKLYDTKLNLVIESKAFKQNKIKESNLDDKFSAKKIDFNFSDKILNFWHLYNKNRFAKILEPYSNETIQISEVIKSKSTKIVYYTDENNSILIKTFSPIIRNNNIYGVSVIVGPLSNVDNIIENLSENLFSNLLLTILIVFLVSIFYARSVVNPIKRLSYIANQYRKKNINEASDYIFPDRGDEIGNLSNNFKIMSNELITKINELERFASDVSHELKNPLASIKSANEILKNNSDSDTKKKLIDIIEKDTARINRLITDISNYTRGAVELEKQAYKQEINIVELLYQIIENYGYLNKVKDKKLNFETNFKKDKIFVISDDEKITQIVRAILDNAISFSPENSRILVSCEKTDSYVLIRIVDQGMGVSSEFSEKIFDRFYKDRNENNYEHSGLGLNIARQTAEYYGGSVYLENKKIKGFKGACFVIKLPLKDK